MDKVSLFLREDDWLWSAEWTANGVALSEATAHIEVDGQRRRLRFVGGAPDRERGASTPAQLTARVLRAEGLPLEIALTVRAEEEHGAVGVQGVLVNEGSETLRLGDLELVSRARVDLGENGRGVRAHVSGLSHPMTCGLVSGADGAEQGLDRESHGMVTLAGASPRAFTAGFVTAPTHRPVVSLRYVPHTDETFVSVTARFNGRALEPGERLETGWAVLRADDDPLRALETYGDLVARFTPPLRTPGPAGWCSWYAIRLPISHAFTLENARVVAEHFRGLGMDLMLLDHGWQEGDICGDWDPDPVDFPGGLEALARDLEALGLKLGLWIAPTDIARTSRLFQEHPEWMLRDAAGRPGTTWRWYWDPYPLQCQLDATQQGAYDYLVKTFQRLTAAGSRYYKIDFIAACADENLHPAGPNPVRGWDPLRRAMQAIREGAGEDAYVRFCQTPPLLSVGVADGVFATSDTLDAGTSTWPTLREVFRTSAAQYWIHNRLHVHDACDMSIRLQGGTEECRLRATMLALSGSSIMYSDDLTRLPEERIRMMQQTLPGFEEAARPINLFSADMPDIWLLRCRQAGLEWDLVALFNFSDEQRDFPVSWDDLGIPADRTCLVREFWTGAFHGAHTGSASFALPGLAARVFALWPAFDRPQFIGTDLHLSQGLAELVSLDWEPAAGRLSGALRRAPGIRGRVYVHTPAGWTVDRTPDGPLPVAPGVWAVEAVFRGAECPWELRARQDRADTERRVG